MKTNQMARSLFNAAMGMKPDIAQAVGVASKFPTSPSAAHLTAVKQILCCLMETITEVQKKVHNSNSLFIH